MIKTLIPMIITSLNIKLQLTLVGLLLLCATFSLGCEVFTITVSESEYIDDCYRGYGNSPGGQKHEISEFMDTYCTNNEHELCTETYSWIPQLIESVCLCTWDSGYVKSDEESSWYVSSHDLSVCSDKFGLPSEFVWELYSSY